jgi:hypothetical protein
MKDASVDLEWTDIRLHYNPNYLRIVIQEVSMGQQVQLFQVDKNSG